MKLKNSINKNKNKSPLKIAGSILTASLIMFGAAACNEAGETAYEAEEVAYEEPVEEGILGDDLNNERVTVANTATVNYFDDWDTNKDLRWSEAELTTGLSGTDIYDEFDANNDNRLAEDELYEGLYNEWDEDEDGFLSNEEYTAGYSAWEDDFGANFGTWDTNDDEILDENEFYAGFGDVGLYNDWDLNNDNYLEENELYSGFFNTWDDEDDGFIDNTEYNEVGFGEWYEEV